MALRIGVVGAGGNARTHLRRFLAMPDVEIAGLADPSQESLAATRAAVEEGIVPFISPSLPDAKIVPHHSWLTSHSTT